jgi:hypothetical protein
MSREEIEEFIEGTGSPVWEQEQLLPGIDNGFVGWDDWNDRPIYDWDLCHRGLIKKGRTKEDAESHLNQLKEQGEDLALAGEYEPPLFIMTP